MERMTFVLRRLREGGQGEEGCQQCGHSHLTMHLVTPTSGRQLGENRRSQLEAALRAANKEVELTIYPDFGNDGHELFFELRDSYWLDVLAFLEVL